MVIGVTRGFSKDLSLIGVGYTAEKKGDFLIVNAGYSHPVYMEIPENITIDVPSATSIVVKGANKQNVGDVAAKISLRTNSHFRSVAIGMNFVLFLIVSGHNFKSGNRAVTEALRFLLTSKSAIIPFHRF